MKEKFNPQDWLQSNTQQSSPNIPTSLKSPSGDFGVNVPNRSASTGPDSVSETHIPESGTIFNTPQLPTEIYSNLLKIPLAKPKIKHETRNYMYLAGIRKE